MLRAILAVVLGYLVMAVFVIAGFIPMWMILGSEGALRPGTFEASTAWAVMSLPLSFVAAVLGGLVAAAIARAPRSRAVHVLAGIVLVLGLISAVFQMASGPPALDPAGPQPGDGLTFSQAGSVARQPLWVAFLLPFLGVTGVLLGARLRPAGRAAATLVALVAMSGTGTTPAGDARKPGPGAVELSRLAWMAGAWSGEEGGVIMEEHWIPPRGNIMLGLHRDVRPSKATFFEYLRIQHTDDGIFFVASPNGVPGAAFRLVEVQDRRVVFANPEHDYPQRIIYWREGDVLHARIEGTDKGRERSAQWSWHLTSPPAP